MASPNVLQWKDLVEKYARRYGVPLSVALGIMEIESGGDPKARSRAGAMGLMQVMPSNFRKGEDGMDPETNIRRGVEMLAERYKRYGNWDSAAAGYFGAVDAKGNPTATKDAGGVSGLDYIQQFKLANSRYKGVDMGDGNRTPSAEEGYWNADVSGPPSKGDGGLYGGGVDSTIADLYRQEQAEKKKVDVALEVASRELAAAKGALQSTEGKPIAMLPGSPEYAAAVSRLQTATSKVASYKAASQQLANSLRMLKTQHATATRQAANQAIQYAYKADAAARQGYKDYLSDAVAMGRLNVDQAKLAWDEAQSISKDWMTAIQQGYSAAAQLMPKLAMQEDVDALWEDINRVGAGTRYGGASGKAPRVIPLEAVLTPYMDAIKQYMPPVNAIDWKKVMTAPEVGVSAKDLPSPEEYRAGARANVEMPMSIAPLPSGGYVGGEPEMSPTGGTGGIGVNPGLSQAQSQAAADKAKWDKIGAASLFEGQQAPISSTVPTPAEANYYGGTSIDALIAEMNRSASASLPEEEEDANDTIQLPPELRGR